jgi:hypothetical protein
VTSAPLELTRAQVLAYRRGAGALEHRLPPGTASLRRAAWAGLQDSMPRAALLSIHARMAGTTPSSWEDPSLVQLWGPRYSAYVVAARDLAVFSLGRLPDEGEPGLESAEQLADLLATFLGGRRMGYGEAGHALGIPPNSLRYAAPTGRVLIRWDGARRPAIWTVPAPQMDPLEARLELARRHLHVLGPSTAGSFARWAGIRPPRARAAFEVLRPSLTPVRTAVGDGWILTADEPAFRAPAPLSTAVRLLPAGDAYTLLQGSDRDLVLPDAAQRDALWTPRVWPGAVLVAGEIVGTWRRADADLVIEAWRRLTAAEREAVESEAASLPLPGLAGRIRVRWTGASAPG